MLRLTKYSTSAGKVNITTLRPDRQAFLAKEDSIGMKFARTPIDEPPKIAPPKIKKPNTVAHHYAAADVVISLELLSAVY